MNEPFWLCDEGTLSLKRRAGSAEYLKIPKQFLAHIGAKHGDRFSLFVVGDELRVRRADNGDASPVD